MRRFNIGDKIRCTESGVRGICVKFYTPTACEEQTMVGCVLMTEVSIVQIGQSTVTLAMNGKGETELKRSTETRRSQAEIKANLQKH